MDYKINENCVLVLKCNDERNFLDVAVQEVEDIYGVYLKEYKIEFSRNENHVYTIDDFENIICFFNKVDSNILVKTNKFTYDFFRIVNHFPPILHGFSMVLHIDKTLYILYNNYYTQ